MTRFTFLRMLLALLVFLVPMPLRAAAAPLPSAAATANTVQTLWPAIPFLRGADLCQFQDGYGQSQRDYALQVSASVRQLMEGGASADEALATLLVSDSLVEKERKQARAAGMDITLEGLFKAGLDELYRQRQPVNRAVSFLNSQDLMDMLGDLRLQRNGAHLRAAHLQRLSGFLWGSYSYAAGCSGELVVTLHVELKTGESTSFMATGTPSRAMGRLAEQAFAWFQRKRFPYTVNLGDKPLTLLGGPGGKVGLAPRPEAAERACTAMSARLPTAEEYDLLSCLGEWNGGLDLCRKDWALAGGKVFADDLRNPSPVRTPEETNATEYAFICVR